MLNLALLIHSDAATAVKLLIIDVGGGGGGRGDGWTLAKNAMVDYTTCICSPLRQTSDALSLTYLSFYDPGALPWQPAIGPGFFLIVVYLLFFTLCLHS